MPLRVPAQRQPYPQSVKGIHQIEDILHKHHDGIARSLRREEPVRPQEYGEHVDKIPDVPLLGESQGHQNLPDYVEHDYGCVQNELGAVEGGYVSGLELAQVYPLEDEIRNHGA